MHRLFNIITTLNIDFYLFHSVLKLVDYMTTLEYSPKISITDVLKFNKVMIVTRIFDWVSFILYNGAVAS